VVRKIYEISTHKICLIYLLCNHPLPPGNPSKTIHVFLQLYLQSPSTYITSDVQKLEVIVYNNSTDTLVYKCVVSDTCMTPTNLVTFNTSIFSNYYRRQHVNVVPGVFPVIHQ
jgi:hypothetical protein